MRLILVPALLALCACAGQGDNVSGTALLPLDSLLAEADPAGAASIEARGAAVTARAAVLRQRAAQLVP